MRTLFFVLVALALGACTSDEPDVDTPAPGSSISPVATATSPTSSSTAEPSPALPSATVLPTATASPLPDLIVSPERRSPDGRFRAYVEFTFAGCPTDCAVVFERANSIEVTRIPFDDPAMARIASAWVGYTVDAWFDDGSGVVLGGSRECDGAGLLPVVIVGINGTVIDQGVSARMGASGAYVSPSGRFLLSLQRVEVAWGNGVGCGVNGSAEVIDLLTGDVAAGVPDDGSALVDWEWLDGQNLAYGRRAPPDPEDGTCAQQLLVWKALPVDWSLLAIP